jgi:hypothetical protein
MDADLKTPMQQGTPSAFHAASCSGSSDLTEKRRKQKIQKNAPLQDKALLTMIFANEAKKKQTPIYQKTEML